jgi:hypothetical protein
VVVPLHGAVREAVRDEGVSHGVAPEESLRPREGIGVPREGGGDDELDGGGAAAAERRVDERQEVAAVLNVHVRR